MEEWHHINDDGTITIKDEDGRVIVVKNVYTTEEGNFRYEIISQDDEQEETLCDLCNKNF